MRSVALFCRGCDWQMKRMLWALTGSSLKPSSLSSVPVTSSYTGLCFFFDSLENLCFPLFLHILSSIFLLAYNLFLFLLSLMSVSQTSLTVPEGWPWSLSGTEQRSWCGHWQNPADPNVGMFAFVQKQTVQKRMGTPFSSLPHLGVSLMYNTIG